MDFQDKQFDFSNIKAVISDVDGVMTGGEIIVTESGEQKHFSVRDGLGIKLLQKAGLRFAILSGRRSAVVLKRAEELGIETVMTGRIDKQTAMEEILKELGLDAKETVYIGDDLPDLAPLAMAAVGFCPKDAVREVREAADFVVPLNGGKGVVRAVIEIVLQARGEWDDLVSSFEVTS